MHARLALALAHVSVLASFSLATSAFAQETSSSEQDGDGDGDGDGYVTPSHEPSAAKEPVAQLDDIGGATGFAVREGLYVHGALGAFTRFGGYAKEQEICPETACAPVFASDLQPSVALALGVDVTSWLATQAQLSVGYVAGAAAYGARTPDVPVDYALSRAEIAGVGRIDVFDRWALTLTFGAGAAAITPSPGREQPWLGGSATAGAGVRLLSLLPSMSIGADVLWHGALFPAVVPGDPEVADQPLFVHSLSMAPVIKYVF